MPSVPAPAADPSGPAGGADFLQLDPSAAPRRDLVGWLTEAVRTAVVDGRLPPGSRLPATRVLAADLRISRGVVVESYQRLGEEGLVDRRPRTGTTVLPGRAPQPPRPADHGTALRPLRGRDVEFDLSPGVPDLSAFPRAAWSRAQRAALSAATPADLGYGDPRGSLPLRIELSGWLGRTRGVRAAPDDIIVVAGVAQALALLARVLRSRGTAAVAVEDPGSRGTREELRHWGLDPRPVPVDDQGLRVGHLAGSGLDAVLLTPAHQFPTGVVLAPERRRELLAWASDPGRLIVEDDYDAEYRYDRAPVPALQSSAPAAVAHTGSTSKTLAPGMRLGWLIPPAHLIGDLLAAKHASDLGSPALPQLALAELIASGSLDRHVRRTRLRHRRRRDALLAALAEHLPRARVHGAAAGLHLLVTLPDAGCDDVELAARIADAGVLVHPLSSHRQRPGPAGLVLGYAATPPDRLREAAGRIAAALAAGGSPPRR